MNSSIQDRGIVKAVEGDRAYIEIEDTTDCEQCGIKKICTINSRSDRGILARNPMSAKIGQSVLVRSSENILIKLSMMQYGLPLLGFFLGISIAYISGMSIPHVVDELLLFLSGIVGLFLSGIVSFIWAKSQLLFEISKISHKD